MWTRALAAAAIIVIVSGCGEAVENRGASTGSSPAQAAAATRLTTPPRAGRQPAPRPPRSVPTRLVAGPVVFRLVGGATSGPDHGNQQFIRYAMIFRLNRPKLHLAKDPRDKDAPTPLPDGARTPVGTFSLGKLTFDFDLPFSAFDVDAGVDPDNCIVGGIPGDNAGATRELDRIAIGERVQTRLQPLTPKPGGGARLGIRYIRHPRMQLLRVQPEAGASRIVASGERAKVQRIGCSATLIA